MIHGLRPHHRRGPGRLFPITGVLAAHCHTGRHRCHATGRAPAPHLSPTRRSSTLLPLAAAWASSTYGSSSSKATAALAPSNVPDAICRSDALALSASVPGPCIQRSSAISTTTH